VNVIGGSPLFGAVSGRAWRTGTTNTVKCSAAEALRGEFCGLRFASAQLTTVHKLADTAQTANAFVAKRDLLIPKDMVVLQRRFRAGDATLLPLWWELSLTVAFQRLGPKGD
jgi:hypothetical protein